VAAAANCASLSDMLSQLRQLQRLSPASLARACQVLHGCPASQLDRQQACELVQSMAAVGAE
jgi:hypothetical protein